MKDASAPAASQPRTVRRAPQGPQALMPLPCKKAEGLQYNNFKCPECQMQFSGKTELVTHFQQIRGAPNSVRLLFFLKNFYYMSLQKAWPLSLIHFFSSVSDVYAVLAPHDAAEPLRRLRPPEDPQTQSASRLPRVRRHRPAGELSDALGGGLSALRQAYRIQVCRRVPKLELLAFFHLVCCS